MDKIRGEFIDIVEWTDDTRDTIVWRFPRHENEIKMNAQRVDAMSTVDQDVLFRLLLLPLWIATYLTGGKMFHVYVNANTGKVIGERPYSALKIVAAVVVVATAYLIYNAYGR